jgi:hypothetical protein
VLLPISFPVSRHGPGLDDLIRCIEELHLLQVAEHFLALAVFPHPLCEVLFILLLLLPSSFLLLPPLPPP